MSDVVSDFDDGDNDVLDIADILDGDYTYGVDTLTDFVQITHNGTDSAAPASRFRRNDPTRSAIPAIHPRAPPQPSLF
jgi:hypothetical protein